MVHKRVILAILEVTIVPSAMSVNPDSEQGLETEVEVPVDLEDLGGQVDEADLEEVDKVVQGGLEEAEVQEEDLEVVEADQDLVE